MYTIDLDGGEDTLQGAFVLSTEASAVIVSVDPSEALLSPGVVDYISYKDVPGMFFPVFVPLLSNPFLERRQFDHN